MSIYEIETILGEVIDLNLNGIDYITKNSDDDCKDYYIIYMRSNCSFKISPIQYLRLSRIFNERQVVRCIS